MSTASGHTNSDARDRDDRNRRRNNHDSHTNGFRQYTQLRVIVPLLGILIPVMVPVFAGIVLLYANIATIATQIENQNKELVEVKDDLDKIVHQQGVAEIGTIQSQLANLKTGYSKQWERYGQVKSELDRRAHIIKRSEQELDKLEARVRALEIKTQ